MWWETQLLLHYTQTCGCNTDISQPLLSVWNRDYVWSVSVPNFKTLLTGQCPANSLTSSYQTTATKLSTYTWLWLGALVLVVDGISCPLFQTSYSGITESKNSYATIPKISFIKWYFYIRKLQTFHLRNSKSKTHTTAFWSSSTTQIKNFKLNFIWNVWQHKQFRQ
jgi:hypothetical protein